MALQVKLGEQLGHGSVPAGLPGGAGGPGGPPSPFPGTGWEVKVLAAPDFGTLLAVLPPQVVLTQQFAKQLNDLGSGTVTLDMDAAFWAGVTLPNSQPAHYLLDYEHVWQVWQDGVCRFEFLGETVTETLVDGSEQRIATVTGPGTAATLKWAMAAPLGFPSSIQYKLDALSDGFSEVDGSGNFVLDYGLWNASAPASRLSINPPGSARLAGSPGTTYLGTTAYDATNTLVSAQVSPIVSPDPAGNSLNGSQVTQMYVQSLNNSNYYALIGLSATTLYAQLRGPSGTFTQSIASASVYGNGNGDYQYWQISEAGGQGSGPGTFYFWTSSDGQNWTQQWKVVHNWDATNCGLYFTATYSVDNTQYAAITDINGNVSTSSLTGPAYYSKPIVGGVWLDLLRQAQARGTVPFVTTGQLSGATDSFGNPWTDRQSVQIANGTDLFTLLGAHTSMVNADWVMQPGFRLQVGIPAAGKITLGTDRSSTVIFRDGMDCASRARVRARNQVSNLLGVINSDGRTITATDGTSVTAYGQRESWLQAGMQITPADLEAVATAADLENGTEVLSWTCTVAPYLPGRTVFKDFDAGDWVGLERPDFSGVDVVRVVAIAVQTNPDGSETHELTLSSYIAWLQEQLSYIMTKLGGGFVNVAGTTAIASSISSPNAPTVFSFTLGGLGDVASGGPGGNAPLVYDPVTGRWVPAGGTVPLSIGGANGQVTIDSQGGSVSVSSPTGVPGDAGAPGPVPVTTTTPTGTTVTDSSGTPRVVIGHQSDGTVTVVEVNAPAPGIPDAPAVGAVASGLVVGWDGLLAGASPLSDFLWTELHMSTTSGFTPSSSTLQAALHAGGTYTVGNLTPGTAYYVVLVAVNTSRVSSTPSTQVSGTPLAATGGNHVTFAATAPSSPGAGDVWYDTSNGNEAHQWNGTSWTAYQLGTGAISFTAQQIGGVTVYFQGTAPASPHTGDLWYNTSSGNQLSEYNGTSWTAYQWGTAAIANGAIGTGQVNFTASQIGGITTSVASTAPASPHTGDLWYDGSNSYQLKQWNGSAWTAYQFGTAAIAAGSITAALIAAGTITATQIAAGTITAANIQAATITSAQIAANTITSANILANTITAADIAAGTITAAQIATGTITGSNMVAGTVTATQIQAGTITASLLAASIVKAGIVDSTVVTGATLQNSTTDPRTSINPDGSISITNGSGTVIFRIGADGTMYWYSSVGVLLMELQPGGNNLIYASATGPAGWDFEGTTDSWTATQSTLTSATSWSATGTGSLLMTHSNTTQPWGAHGPFFLVVAGTTVSMQAVLYTSAVVTGVSVGFTFWSGSDGSGTVLGTAAGDQGTFSTTAGSEYNVSITGASVPAGAHSATFFVHSSETTSGATMNIDAVGVAGGLVYSNSPVGGTDNFGNPIPQGVNFVGLPGLTNVFGVEDPWGNQLATIDGSGNVIGQTGSFTALEVGGQDLNADLLPALPQGIVQRGYVPYSSLSGSQFTGIGTTETAIFELDVPVVAGRSYAVGLENLRISFSGTGATALARVRATSDGSTPTTGSDAFMTGATGPPAAAAAGGSINMSRVFQPTTSFTMKMLLTLVASGTGTVGLTNTSSNATFQQGQAGLFIEDLGAPGVPNSAIATFTGGGGTTGGSGTAVVYPATSWSYYGNGVIRNTNGSLYQGEASGNPGGEGSQYSVMNFTAALPGGGNVPAGATINSVKLRLTNLHSWYDSGAYAYICLLPAGDSGSNFGAISGAYYTVAFAEGATLSFDVTTMYNDMNIIDEPYICLRVPAGGTNLTGYGYWWGAGGSNNAYRPRLTVNYTK